MTRRILVLGVTALLLAGCGREPVARDEWTTMGTVAAVQTRGADDWTRALAREVVQKAFADVERLLNAHDPASELSRLAALSDGAVLAQCDMGVSNCYAAAFALRRLSGGAFDPRWRGTNTLDLGAIAKGFAVDRAAEAVWGGDAPPAVALLVDLGGNLKSVGGDWKTGVRAPDGGGLAATVTLRPGEALATSAAYFRGRHIYDARTGRPVANGVRSVTVLHPTSATLADGLSTILFILGPDEGRRFVAAHHPEAAVLWILDDRRVTHDPSGRFAP